MEDNEIVEMLYQHDDQGLEELKNKYEKLLLSFSKKIVCNGEDAKECLNDTYLKVWDSIPPYRPNYLKSFVMKIIRQISIDKYRHNHRKTKDNNSVLYLSDLDYEIKDNKSVESKVSERLLVGHLNKFLEDLDVETQTIFMRKYFFFEDSKTIAERFGLSETNVNVKMMRTREKLKKYLESEGYEIESNR